MRQQWYCKVPFGLTTTMRELDIAIYCVLVCKNVVQYLFRIKRRHLWETLADAYLARGSFQSALKSYNKALELHADPIYPTYKIGVLYQVNF